MFWNNINEELNTIVKLWKIVKVDKGRIFIENLLQVGI